MNSIQKVMSILTVISAMPVQATELINSSKNVEEMLGFIKKEITINFASDAEEQMHLIDTLSNEEKNLLILKLLEQSNGDIEFENSDRTNDMNYLDAVAARSFKGI